MSGGEVGADGSRLLGIAAMAAAVLFLLLGPLLGLVGGWWSLRRGNRKAALTLLSFARVLSLWMAFLTASLLVALLMKGGVDPGMILGPPHPLHLAVAYPTLGWYFSDLLLRKLDHVRCGDPRVARIPREVRP